MKRLTISRLTCSGAPDLSKLLSTGRPEYSRYFTPFSTDEKSIAERLKNAKHDQYWGMRFGGRLVGFFMLRGFDEGYERPSFGVYVAERYSNLGLSKLALQYSLSWCRLNDIPSVMLKVHADNKYARRVYEQAGFKFIEKCPRSGYDVMEKRWDEPT